MGETWSATQTLSLLLCCITHSGLPPTMFSIHSSINSWKSPWSKPYRYEGRNLWSLPFWSDCLCHSCSWFCLPSLQSMLISDFLVDLLECVILAFVVNHYLKITCHLYLNCYDRDVYIVHSRDNPTLFTLLGLLMLICYDQQINNRQTWPVWTTVIQNGAAYVEQIIPMQAILCISVSYCM